MLSYLPFCLPASSYDLPRAEQTVSNYPIFVSRLLVINAWIALCPICCVKSASRRDQRFLLNNCACNE